MNRLNRLTHERNNGIKSGYWSPNKKDELIERLAGYENTGLSPEEIEERDKSDTDELVKIMRELEEHRWIPVEERLPEEFHRVLVTTQTKKGLANINLAYREGKYWHGNGTMANVIAWMPLLKPYQPEKLKESGR